ncbi:unnamed protein product [Effrenium voratum]|uniref:Uncharacterized protein n=1 Tax=Effrenium voratum TaxID=2562239 RepID=A0AA36NI64_9DINO|nr:unnamed protein product [Effrenium voratum]CAJ1407764.1 unnamed protein product [Effrenium voratum]CAJ1438302.1 unnamed protein product [Effrenium voratum]
MAGKRSSRAVLVLGACAALYGKGFVAPEPVQRRAVLSAGLLGTLGAAAPGAQAADFFGLPSVPGPFEMDPKDSVVIGDANDPAVKEARGKVEYLLKQAEDALDKLEKDPQVDLQYMCQDFGIGELRLATNTINDIMDDKTAAATQRWQRLMIQAKYQWEDDMPFPTTKRGEQRPRGDKRNDRIKASLKNYIKASKELLQFF